VGLVKDLDGHGQQPTSAARSGCAGGVGGCRVSEQPPGPGGDAVGRLLGAEHASVESRSDLLPQRGGEALLVGDALAGPPAPGRPCAAVLVQPQVRALAGGTAAAGPREVTVAVVAGSPAGLHAGRERGSLAVVGADGRLRGAPPPGVDPEVVAEAATLARRTRDATGDGVIEWARIDRGVVLLQARPAAGAELGPAAPGAAAPTAASDPALRSATALRLAVLAQRCSGPVAEELVLPWAAATPGLEAAPAAGVGAGPAAAADRAWLRSLADRLTAAAWALPAAAARPRRCGRCAAPTRVPPWSCWRACGRSTRGWPPRCWPPSRRRRRQGPGSPTPGSRSSGQWCGRRAGACRAGPPRRGSGSGGSAGVGVGRPWPVPDSRGAGQSRPSRTLLVTGRPDPALAPLLWTASGLVAADGSSAAHLLQVARSLAVPAVVACPLPRQDPAALLAVDGHTGEVAALPG
jgi:hypothetical protein